MKLLFTALLYILSASFAFNQTIWSRAKTTTDEGAKCMVEADGQISSIEVHAPLIPSYLTDEAIRIIQVMPTLKAGKHNQKAVRSQITIPITFDPADFKK